MLDENTFEKLESKLGGLSNSAYIRFMLCQSEKELH